MRGDSLSKIPEIPKRLEEKLHCRLIHSRVPKRTKSGIRYICKEGCDDEKFCKDCKNELVACVCMGEDDEKL